MFIYDLSCQSGRWLTAFFGSRLCDLMHFGPRFFGALPCVDSTLEASGHLTQHTPMTVSWRLSAHQLVFRPDPHIAVQQPSIQQTRLRQVTFK